MGIKQLLHKFFYGDLVQPGTLVTVEIDPGSHLKPCFATFGCMVERLGEKYMLTCEHVFHGFSVGDKVWSYDDKRKQPKVFLGRICEFGESGDYLLVELRRRAPVRARFSSPIGALSKEVLKGQKVTDLTGIRVQMDGGISGPRLGVLEGLVQFLPGKNPGISVPCFEITAEQEKKNRTPDFGSAGDSGSLVVTIPVKPQAVGLLVRVMPYISSHGKPPFKGPVIGRAYATPVDRVLRSIGNAGRSDAKIVHK